MSKITEEWMKKKGACKSGIKWVLSEKTQDPVELIQIAIKSGKLELLRYANWGIVRLFSKKKKVQYAVYAAEKALHIYEKKYNSDKPRKAIESAKRYIKNQTKENKEKCRAAASAAYAAYSAADAADAAATYSASAASAYAAYAASTYSAVKGINLYKEILKYGIKLLRR